MLFFYGINFSKTKNPNRLRVVNDNDQQLQHYIYDANGERILKASSEMESVYENGQIDAASTTMGLYTTYVNPYMVVDASQHYSKHYFNGTQRVASKIGSEDISVFEVESGLLKQQKQTEKQSDNSASQNTEATDLDTLKRKQISDFNYYLGKNSLVTKMAKVTYKEFKKEEKPTDKTTSRITESSAQPVQAQAASLPEMYYYHSDHLGTGTFLSDTYGNPYHIEDSSNTKKI